MEPITIRISSSRLEEINREAEQREMSKSEIIRERLDKLEDAEELRTELEANLDELRTENERLQREKRQILDQREENTELVEYVEDEQRYRQASLATRIRWWITGMD